MGGDRVRPPRFVARVRGEDGAVEPAPRDTDRVLREQAPNAVRRRGASLQADLRERAAAADGSSGPAAGTGGGRSSPAAAFFLRNQNTAAALAAATANSTPESTGR